MYLRKEHTETDTDKLYKLILENPLGVLTTAIRSPQFPFIQSSHIPFVLDTSSSGKTKLRAHVARANPQAKALVEAAKDSGSNVLDEEVLVLFTSAVDHYITPKYYTETKPQSGKVVPTWNYAAVQVYGKIKLFHDAKASETGEFIGQQIHDLSSHAEESIMGFTGKDGAKDPWTVSEAPDSYVKILQKAIIGIEIEVERIDGKFKMSQESSPGDVQGVVDGLNQLGTDRALKTSTLVSEYN